MRCRPCLPLPSPSAREFDEAVIDGDHVALDDTAAKAGTARSLAPDLRTYGLAGKDRRGKAHLDPPEARRIIAAERAQQRMSGDTERAEAMQDRPREPGRRRDIGVRVQRVVVAVQTIEQRRLRQGREI